MVEEKEPKQNSRGKIDSPVSTLDDSSLGNTFMDRLCEELTCAISLDFCFEPSTASCGHSFCKICLRAAADKCGNYCPKCTQLIGGGQTGSINMALWNTIQILFPEQIDGRKDVAEGSHKDVAEGSDLLESVHFQTPPPRMTRYRTVTEALNSPEGVQSSIERQRRTSSHNRQQRIRTVYAMLLNSRESVDDSVASRRRRNLDMELAVEQDQDNSVTSRRTRMNVEMEPTVEEDQESAT